MNWKMPPSIKGPYHQEIFKHYEYLNNKDYLNAWNCLERSHILGQSFPIEHTYSHWLMLKFGCRFRNIKEVLGQIPRLLVGGIKSFVGVIPLGNTGGANVSPLRPMAIPVDLQKILNKTEKKSPHV